MKSEKNIPYIEEWSRSEILLTRDNYIILLFTKNNNNNNNNKEAVSSVNSCKWSRIYNHLHIYKPPYSLNLRCSEEVCKWPSHGLFFLFIQILFSFTRKWGIRGILRIVNVINSFSLIILIILINWLILLILISLTYLRAFKYII